MMHSAVENFHARYAKSQHRSCPHYRMHRGRSIKTSPVYHRYSPKCTHVFVYI